MTDFREPGPDAPPTVTHRGVWTTRPTARTQTAPAPQPWHAAAAVPQAAPSRPVRRWGRAAAIRTGLIQRILRLAFWTAVVAAVLVAGLIFSYRWVAPPTTTLMLAQRLVGTRIERAWRPLEQISPHLARAVVMSEDAGFCGHRGVDFNELERAYERGLEGANSGGASTVSMQVIKNLFLWPSKSYVRKAIEIPLTLAADRWWGKRRMLEIYLNSVEWGPGIFGAEAAAQAYFQKPARELNEREAALLAVALPNPLLRDPGNPSDRQRRMATVVQGRMKDGAKNVRCLVQLTGLRGKESE